MCVEWSDGTVVHTRYNSSGDRGPGKPPSRGGLPGPRSREPPYEGSLVWWGGGLASWSSGAASIRLEGSLPAHGDMITCLSKKKVMTRDIASGATYRAYVFHMFRIWIPNSHATQSNKSSNEWNKLN